MDIKKGEELVAVRGCGNLTVGKLYICLNGTEEGIFKSRPYVSVVDDNGAKYSCHQSRFKRA